MTPAQRIILLGKPPAPVAAGSSFVSKAVGTTTTNAQTNFVFATGGQAGDLLLVLVSEGATGTLGAGAKVNGTNTAMTTVDTRTLTGPGYGIALYCVVLGSADVSNGTMTMPVNSTSAQKIASFIYRGPTLATSKSSLFSNTTSTTFVHPGFSPSSVPPTKGVMALGWASGGAASGTATCSTPGAPAWATQYADDTQGGFWSLHAFDLLSGYVNASTTIASLANTANPRQSFLVEFT